MRRKIARGGRRSVSPNPTSRRPLPRVPGKSTDVDSLRLSLSPDVLHVSCVELIPLFDVGSDDSRQVSILLSSLRFETLYSQDPAN